MTVDNKLDLILQEIKNVKDDVSELKSDMVEVKADIVSLKSDVAELKSDMVEVKADVAELKSDMVEVKADVAELKSDMVEVKADISGLKGNVAELYNKTDILRMRQDITNRKLDDLLWEVRSSRREICRDIHHLKDVTETLVAVLQSHDMLPVL